MRSRHVLLLLAGVLPFAAQAEPIVLECAGTTEEFYGDLSVLDLEKMTWTESGGVTPDDIYVFNVVLVDGDTVVFMGLGSHFWASDALFSMTALLNTTDWTVRARVMRHSEGGWFPAVGEFVGEEIERRCRVVPVPF